VRSCTPRFPDARWRVRLEPDDLLAAPGGDDELVDAARRRMLDRGWDLCVCLTDLPLHVGRRPVVAYGATVHRVGLVCVPALGAVAVRRRTREAVLRLVDALLGEAEDTPGAAAAEAGRRARPADRLREVIGTGRPRSSDGTVRFTAQVLTGHIRLLVGMVRANQPWRLTVGLSRACGAAAATGVFALVTSDVWRIADSMSPVRMGALTIVSVAVIVATLIVGAGLWERPQNSRAREQAVLFNIATTATVVIGVAALYLTLLVLALLIATLLITPDALGHALGHGAGPRDCARLAWLACSLATLGGALGARLETHEAVRHTAYTYRTSTSTEQDTAAGSR
jgi:hypothetical protein